MVENDLATVASETGGVNPATENKHNRDRKHKHKKHKHSKHRKDKGDRVRGADSEPESGEIVIEDVEVLVPVGELPTAPVDSIMPPEFSHPKSVPQDSLRVAGSPEKSDVQRPSPSHASTVEESVHAQSRDERRPRRDEPIPPSRALEQTVPDVVPDVGPSQLGPADTTSRPPSKGHQHYRNGEAVPDRALHWHREPDMPDPSRGYSRSKRDDRPPQGKADATIQQNGTKHRTRSRSPAGLRRLLEARDQPEKASPYHGRGRGDERPAPRQEEVHGHRPNRMPNYPPMFASGDRNFERPGRDGFRDRSRSHGRGDGRDRVQERYDRPRDANGRDYSRDKEQSRGREREHSRERHLHKRSRSRERHRGDDRKHDVEPENKRRRHGDDKEEDVDMAPAMLEEDEEAELKRIEESRRRRQEILQKHKAIEAVVAPTASAMAQATEQHTPPRAAPPTPPPASPMPSPAPAEGEESPAPQHMFDHEATPEGDRTSSASSGNADGPVLDIFNEEDEANSQAAVKAVVGEAPPVVAAVDDMFAEEVPDDMFTDAAPAALGRAAPATTGLVDAYDDPDGYYNFQVGEIMDGRYEVFALKGKGVFSTVLRARDLARRDETGGHPEVAIKMIRSNEVMFKAGQLEKVLLKTLAAQDPDNRKHCIRMLRDFEYRSHLCLVFEAMDMNLRELTNKYGRNVGLNIKAVGQYAAQLLIALRHLKKCNVLHSDIKPDNILVNHRRTKVKMCDFGSGMFAGDTEVTPYLCSRFYRAPEVMLGLKYDFAMDMWAIGCVIYELFTGKILFQGETNNDMLRLFMDVKGPIPKKMLRKGVFADKHFDQATGTTSFIQLDPQTKQPIRRLVPAQKNNFAALLGRSDAQDRAKVAALADLLEKMTTLDPEKRITPDEAMHHPFVREFLPKKLPPGSKPAEQPLALTKK